MKKATEIQRFICSCGKSLQKAEDIDIYTIEGETIILCVNCGGKVNFENQYFLCICEEIIPLTELRLQVDGGQTSFTCPLCAETAIHIG